MLYSNFEIKDVVFCLYPLKAPRPDEFSVCFFRKYWDVVGASLCAIVKDFFSSGVLDPNLNNTFICLIPKVEFPHCVDHFRLISLCNFSYKVIAKILSNRLRPLMNDLVSPFQSAFIPGRWIAESSILTQEIIHKIRQKKGYGGLMALKLDMHKAYDKMEWSFLDKVLCANGFNDRSRKLLMACVTSVSYAVLLNGCPLKKLTPQRGLRQGDPLSSFLFLLCQEVLSKLITKADVQGLVHGIKIAQSAIPVSHLMFADDTILFSRAKMNEAKKLMECLSTYEKWSGQSCSKSKSSAFFRRTCVVEGKATFWCILDTRTMILKGSISVAASRDSINFWQHPWIPWLEYQEFMALMNGMRNRGYTIKSLADISTGNEWNEELVLQVFGIDLGNSISTSDGRTGLLNYIGCVFSVIWQQRNAFYINNIPANPFLALAKAEKDFLELQNMSWSNRGGHLGGNQAMESSMNEAIVLPRDILVRHVFFTDASWVRGEAGIAAISVDTSSRCWFVNSQRQQSQSALEGEFRAILLALSWAVDLGWREVLILSDSKVAVQALSSSKGCLDWKVSSVF
uniref:Reverse transcriptase domain-containing protein n=1 Tax=Cannabis sativa TaxID=3483 RepID=A0A803NX12_CANSA